MREENNTKKYTAYDYKDIVVAKDMASLCLDGYASFGWVRDENYKGLAYAQREIQNISKIRLKRDRKIINKTELIRLERHFESCIKDLEKLERSKTSLATAWAIAVGIIGTAFMAGSVFAVTHNPPLIFLCVVLALPGFAGWILPLFVYKLLERKKSRFVLPMIEEKLDEIHLICEKGAKLSEQI